MGDRTYTYIEFSGVISEEQADELAELLRDQGCCANDEQSDLRKALVEGSSFYDGECNYARMDDIEAWCSENDVAYLKTWEPGGGYGPGIELWCPGMKNAKQCASVESSPAVTLDQLKKAYESNTVADLIASLDRFNNFGPALKVLAVDDWTPELCVLMAKRKLEAV